VSFAVGGVACVVAGVAALFWLRRIQAGEARVATAPVEVELSPGRAGR